MAGVEAYRGRVGGEELVFEMSDSEYVDNTALIFKDRELAARMAPKVNGHFARWGMQVHEKKPADTKIKTMILFCAPASRPAFCRAATSYPSLTKPSNWAVS